MNNEEKILQILQEMKTDQAKMRTELSEIKADQAKMRAEQAEMRDLLQKVAVTQEAVILPRLDLLAEGHQNLLDTLAPKDRVETLEEEVDTLKTVVRLLTHDVAELKKAQ